MPYHHPPSWSPYAEEILGRLSWTIALKDSGFTRYGRDEVRTAPDAEPPLDVAGEGVAIPELDHGGIMDADDLADDATPQPSPVQVSLALRLAASFGSRESFLRCLEPGAITVLGGAGPKLLRLALEGDDDEISRYALRAFHELIAEAPGVAAPVLILMPDEAAPAQELARYLPPAVLLAPVRREIMLLHPRLVYEDGGSGSCRPDRHRAERHPARIRRGGGSP